MKTLVWHGCYEKSLSGFIVPDAFQHPAKFSLALVERVYDHMISRGWLWQGGNYKVDAEIRAHCIEELGCKRIPLGDTIPQCQLDTSRRDTHQQTSSQSEPLPYESTAGTSRAHGSRSQSRTHGSLDPQLFGPGMEEQSQKGLSCTTGMKTLSMTTLQTLPSSSGPDTQKCTEKPSKSRGKNKSTNSKTFSAPNAQPFSKGKNSTETAFATNAESNPEGPQDFVTSRGFVVRNSQPPKIGETIFRVSCKIGDPFGGVGIGGLVAAYRKLEWIGLELEPKFCTLAEFNFSFHHDRLKVLGATQPVMMQGDSRKFAERVAAVVSSPPYSCGLGHGGKSEACERLAREKQLPYFTSSPYGNSPGQIEKLREGNIASVVSSPPYATISAGAGGLNTKPAKKPGQQGGRSAVSASQTADQKYGHTEGQISQLKTSADPIMVGNIVHVDGTVTGVVSSPPLESNCEGGVRKGKLKAPPSNGKGHYSSPTARSAQLERDETRTYGDTAGNIGNTRKETYWGAMHTVYAQCFAAIRPGGHIAIVVKDYCKGGKVVHLCDDTARLLEYVGFQVIERAHAMLVNETTEGDLFNGTQTKRRERKSFFRRLYESKGGPRIDFEVVLFAQKPCKTG